MSAPSQYSSGYVSPVLKDGDGEDIYVRPSIWVSFPSGTGDEDVDFVVSQITGVTSVTLVSSPYLNASQSGPNQSMSLEGGFDIYRVDVSTNDGQSILEQIEALTASPGTARSIEPSFSFTASFEVSVPNDPLWSSQWNLESSQNYDVDALTTWDQTMVTAPSGLPCSTWVSSRTILTFP
jgi:hypothetical protein